MADAAKMAESSGGFGRNQKLVLWTVGIPATLATVFLAVGVGGADVQWWGEFVGGLTQTVVSIAVGGSAIIKGVEAFKGSR